MLHLRNQARRPVSFAFALALLAGSLFVLLLLLATPASAASGDAPNDQIVLTGQIDVGPGQQVGTVVIFHGPAVIEGDVRGSVVAFDGSVTVSGTVRDGVVAFRGPVTIESGARIGGDVVSSGAPTVATDATIGGRVRRLGPTLAPSFFWFRIGVWIAYAVSVLALGLLLILLAPRGLDAAAQAAGSALGASIGWGLALFFGVPIVGVLALVTLVGIPLGAAMLLALLLFYTVGHTVGAWIVGRRMMKPPRGRVPAFLVGLGVVEAASLIPFVGGLVWLATTVVGLGALTVATWRARRPEGSGTAVPAPPVPVPPEPTA